MPLGRTTFQARRANLFATTQRSHVIIWVISRRPPPQQAAYMQQHKYRACAFRLDSVLFFIFGSNWNGCQWHMGTRPPICANTFICYICDICKIVYDIRSFERYIWIYSKHMSMSFLLFSSTRRANTYFCIFWNSNVKHLQLPAINVDFINNLLWQCRNSVE